MRWRLFARSFFIQSLWSFENMQGLAFGYCMEPWLRRCYGGSRERGRQALSRHCVFYNTQPYMVGLGLGMACALEARIAESAEEERAPLEERLEALKKASSGALAAIGDSLFWGAWRPFCAALALAVATAGLAMGAGERAVAAACVGGYLVAYNVPVLLLRWRGLGIGYEWGDRIAQGIGDIPWQPCIKLVRLGGMGLTFGCAAAVLFSIMGGSLGQAGGFALAFAAGWAARARSVTSRKMYAAAALVGVVAASLGTAVRPW
ncbi:MAG: PTS system mannose/fructose/sorbose family transporter subunit IID [Elusimicrobia bacterium]|nr:PTS system mannose/fructose/sorbose family transporter subunit IID [Elusimicrobiota bacterium]